MTVEIRIGKSHYQIACAADEEKKLSELAERLNKRLKDISSSFEISDEKTLLVMAALTLEDEIREEELHKKTEEYFSKQEVFDSISDNIENVTSYVEKLTKKIRDF